jgi:hypothetical protein
LASVVESPVINQLETRISHRVEEQAAGLIGLQGCALKQPITGLQPAAA